MACSHFHGLYGVKAMLLFYMASKPSGRNAFVLRMPLSYAQTEKLINRIYNKGTMIETKINAYKSCHHQTSETMQFIQGKARKSKSIILLETINIIETLEIETCP